MFLNTLHILLYKITVKIFFNLTRVAQSELATKPICHKPVSYTHLDVYKRQGVKMAATKTNKTRNHIQILL